MKVTLSGCEVLTISGADGPRRRSLCRIARCVGPRERRASPFLDGDSEALLLPSSRCNRVVRVQEDLGGAGAMVKFAMAIWAQCLSVRHCIFSVVGQQFLVMHFKVWRLILATEEGCRFAAPIACTGSSEQDNCHHVGIPIESDNCQHLSGRYLLCRL